jgi:hypothetical protein
MCASKLLGSEMSKSVSKSKSGSRVTRVAAVQGDVSSAVVLDQEQAEEDRARSQLGEEPDHHRAQSRRLFVAVPRVQILAWPTTAHPKRPACWTVCSANGLRLPQTEHGYHSTSLWHFIVDAAAALGS